MNNVQLKIITSAVLIRVHNGQDIDSALERYTKLTQDEKDVIKEDIANQLAAESDEA